MANLTAGLGIPGGGRHGWRQPATVGVLLSAAHHPLCGWFRDDVYPVFGTRVCRGCILTWPSLLVGTLLLSYTPIAHGWTPLTLMAVGLLLGGFQGWTYVFRAGAGFRAFAKVVGGFGFAGLLFGLVEAPWGIGVKVVLLGVLALLFLVLSAVRLRSLLRICKACPWQRNWQVCPGFNLDAPAFEQVPPAPNRLLGTRSLGETGSRQRAEPTR